MVEDSFVAPHSKTKSRLMSVLYWGILIVAVFGLVFIADGLFGSGKLTGNVIGSINDATTKLECKQQSYETIEYYEEQVPYEETEYYTQTESGKNCDYVNGCTCIHESWWGLGACDSCECEKSRTITSYRTETKSRTATKLADVCIKLKKWQSPDYNDNWLNYPEIYAPNGERIAVEEATTEDGIVVEKILTYTDTGAVYG